MQDKNEREGQEAAKCRMRMKGQNCKMQDENERARKLQNVG